MREWTEDLSDWMEKKETLSRPKNSDLEKQASQMAHAADSLLQASSHLQEVYSQVLGKFDHANS